MSLLHVIPPEILRQIFQDKVFTVQDWKALRLVKRDWEPQAAGLLFRRIRLSKLELDRAIFFNISKTPYLADKVRELVWEELAEDGRCFNLFDDPRAQDQSPFSEDIHTPELQHLYAQLSRQSESLFWMKNAQAHCTGHLDTMHEFGKDFFAALDAMPGLHTLISRPMHPSRVICQGQDSYPLTVQLLFQRSMPKMAPRNLGFSTFLLLLMVRRHSCNNPIQRLYFASEGTWANIGRIDASLSPAFERITHLDLDLAQIASQSTVDSFTSILRSCKSLRDLRLCEARNPKKDVDNITLADCLSHETLRLPVLHTLQLDEVPVDLHHLTKFVSAHVDSLRVLGITGFVSFEILLMLNRVNNLHLSHFSCCMEDATNSTHGMITESAALEIVNSNAHTAKSDPALVQRVAELAERAIGLLIETQVGVEEEWRPPPAIPIYTHINLDSLMADEPVHQEFIVWDAEMENRVTSSPTESSYEGNAYAAEERLDDQRWREAPLWSWAWSDGSEESSGTPCVYFWKVASDEVGACANEHSTEIWKFSHRNGEVTWGQEPLNFWDDWIGTRESGDHTEPTPFGRRLHEFIKAGPEWTQSQDAAKVKIPFDRACKYDAADDPMSDRSQSWYRIWQGAVRIPSEFWP